MKSLKPIVSRQVRCASIRTATPYIIPSIFGNVEKYELIDHTADLMVKAYGDTLEECFANAGYALFDQTVDLSGIKPEKVFTAEAFWDDPESLLYAFLSELLFLEDSEGMVLCELSVKFGDGGLLCVGKGEILDRNRHRVRSEIKAVTFHMMAVDAEEPSVTVIFDV